MNWKRYDTDELEQQYNIRVILPDFHDWVGRVGTLSEGTRERLGEPSEFRYGDTEKSTYDLFACGKPDAPVHIFFHGGYWQGQDKRNYALVARDLVPRGVSVVVANYDLCPDVTVADINAQCAACVAHVRDHARELGVDPDRLTISGHSAGGQIVARLLSHDWPADGHPVRAALPISGVYDVEPLVHTTINNALHLDAAAARAVSPILESPPPPDIRVKVAVGGAESDEFNRQAAAYARHCSQAGSDVPVLTTGGGNHFSVLDALFLEDGEYFDAVLDLALCR